MENLLKNITLDQTFYDKTNGRSVVSIYFRGSYYDGEAQLHKEDRDVESSFVGQHIALNRAKRSILEDYKERLQTELKYCQNLVNHCRCYKDWEEESNCSKILKKQLKLKEKKIIEVKKEIEKLNKEIKYLGSERLEQAREMIKKKREKQKTAKSKAK